MENARDDFSTKTKELLANRVGMKCSNPSCRKLTCCATAIRRRLKVAKEEKAYSIFGQGEDVAYCFYDCELGEWFNSTREEILKILSSICKEAGLRELHFQRRRYRW